MKPSLFFSWQSDNPDQTNILRRAIQTALKEIEKKTGVAYEYDEATRKLPGSPDIKQVVLAKIEVASIFIADVTNVVNVSDSSSRRHSNSNVMFELGFASAVLGVDRIIQISAPPADTLPFDIKGNRTTILDDRITWHLTNAVAAIQKHNPPTEFERRVAEPARRRNERTNLQGYLSNLPLMLLADSIERLPFAFDRSLASVYDDLAVRRSRPDQDLPADLQANLDLFLNTLGQLVQLGADNYQETSGSLVRLPKLLENPNAEFLAKEAEQLKQALRSRLQVFVETSRQRFPDVNFEDVRIQAERLYAG